jgi:endogenous inhibitor of DNA gyrase (YacG/DUF329 family)
MAKQLTCPQCGKLFQSWRKKQFCSEQCRKRDENKRLRAASGAILDALDPLRGDDASKGPSRPLRGDETALGEPLAELADGISRIAAMSNPTIEAIRRELRGWRIEDARTIEIIARRMRVARSAVRAAQSEVELST